MIRLDHFKQYKRLVAVCVVLTVANLAFQAWHFRARPPNYVVYHRDPAASLVVVHEKAAVDVLEDPHGYTPPSPYAAAAHKGYAVKHIAAYDYVAATESAVVAAAAARRVSPLIAFDFEMQFTAQFVRFFDQLMGTVENCSPQIGSINNDEHYAESRARAHAHREGRVPLYGGHLRENYLDEDVRTEQWLASYLALSPDEINSLGVSHEKFLASMPTHLPDGVAANTVYNDFMKGDGIVYLGGDSYDQLALISIKLLRSTGSRLPVELIVPKRTDFDPELCLRVLPSLNGRCKIMEDYLPPAMMDKIKGYQLKNVALLVSSFKRVLYLDADNVPVKNPDPLFVNEPFKSSHLVVWPDLWRRSTSPLFYRIADIRTNAGVRLRSSYFSNDLRGQSDQISYHDAEGTIPEASSETGQLLIDKHVHFRTLVLSMYYNYYGPNYYYALLSQGAAGEGDKETFIAAAHKLGLPYYQVKEFNREFGPLKNKKRHELFAMGQYDPILDYLQDQEPDTYYSSEFEPDYARSESDNDHSNYDFHYFKSSSLMFLHANWPKLKIKEMFLDNSHGRGPKKDGLRRRLYQAELTKECHGFDYELHLFSSIKWLYCDLEINLAKIPAVNSDDRKNICKEIAEQIVYLSTHT